MSSSKTNNAKAVNWQRVFNRLFEIIDSRSDPYFSGGSFIGAVREVDPYFPNYTQYIDNRRREGKSTSRRDYFYDILLSFDEHSRVRIVIAILDKVKDIVPHRVAALRDELGGVSVLPPVRVDPETWNAERLNRYLSEIDTRITSGNYEGAVTLSYTCLEGFLKAFVRARIPTDIDRDEIIRLSRSVVGHLKGRIDQYPDEALQTLNHIAHMVDRARNRFSESHFDEEAGRWLAVFARDLVTAEIRLLLNFM